jgi:hypothetical protein
VAQSTETSTEKKHVTIIVADQEGDTEKVKLDSHDTIATLLREGLDELYRKQDKNPNDYDVVIAGVVVTDLNQTITQAGLHDRSEVVIAPKDVSRG